MDIVKELHKTGGFLNLDLLAKQVVEGYISGMHKSPFHGFSAEFAEHKIYNTGESTRHIDWKLFAKTDKLYTRKYEEETNLRCHLILDNSASMHYPAMRDQDLNSLNKIGFSVLASACLMEILKRQRDAVGMSIYSDEFEFYSPERSSERHHHMLLHKLDQVLKTGKIKKSTDTYTYLHQIAEKLKRRSLIFLFTDMFQADTEELELFEALRHLKYNRHEVILFHVIDEKRELNFDFENTPRRFTDVETGLEVDLYSDNIRENYKNAVEKYMAELKLQCAKYRIKYVVADINKNFDKILTSYLLEKQKFG
ncbi:DUF58 domain-containing protein [Christiangramia salexigens]|uniref:DUF58 domain-containing protein n=1 Tax=Christiangramia salexigens TaxID=1913577 RepID=A0A1L3J8K3_9FLAO|nr:DUF58 domain-containing protein [Christiangramia salexigens]APG61472.1 hypothetical protein LPB144_11575 [Christiangramia salexigens]